MTETAAFRKMNRDEYLRFMNDSVADYTETLIEGRAPDRETARREAEKEFYGMFPDGLSAKDQFPAIIQDAQSGKAVGEIWFGYEEEDGVRQVFLSEFLIYREERGKGYATAALAEMERIAKADGYAAAL